jgi:hypothetical protein
MPEERRSSPTLAVVFACLGLVWVPGLGAEPEPGLRVVLGPIVGTAVSRAFDGARQRLARPECARIFSDFNDPAGRALQETLDARGLSGPEYLALIRFADGVGQDHCRQGRALALTTPGSRVVYVCGTAFVRAQVQAPERVEATIIHETLHTLGLRENPPTSEAITARVRARCGGSTAPHAPPL